MKMDRTIKVAMALIAAVGIVSTIKADPKVDLYECVQQDTEGKTLPRLGCSDFAADRTFSAIQRLFAQKKNIDGLLFLEALVAAKPFNTAFRVALIEKRVALSDFTGLEDHIKTLGLLSPRSEPIGVTSAKALNEMGKTEDALELLSAHLETHATSREARRLRAQLYEKNKKWKLAEADWRVLELARILAEEKVHQLSNRVEAGEFASVVRELEPIVSARTGRFDATLAELLARSYAGVGRHADANKLWKRVLDLRPDDEEIHFHLSKGLIETKQFDEAILHLSYILFKNQGHTGATYQLSRVRILQERFDLAGRTLAKVSAQDPQETWSVQAQASLWQQLGQDELAKGTLVARNLNTSLLEAKAIAQEAPQEEPQEERAVLSTSSPSQCIRHVVEKGETLETISFHYFNTRSAWNTLLDANSKPLSDPQQIQEGMVIWVPNDKGTGKCGE
jgi:tetratricopeptide (TPR) repeat protein